MQKMNRNLLVFIGLMLILGVAATVEGVAVGGDQGIVYAGLGVFILAGSGYLLFSFLRRDRNNGRL
ncbi:hypothetical protein [Streptomyces sp. NPDC049813]|uniref:hypothetical protein n=1 Tax=Streptomyces sp. NPDC049813 TaxID=3365597 RepID=UPI0037B68EEC